MEEIGAKAAEKLIDSVEGRLKVPAKILLEAELVVKINTIEKAKMASNDDKEELQELQEMHSECKDIVAEIDANNMPEDEAEEILKELLEIKSI